MLEDRHYMRQPTFRSFWSATVVLLVVNVVAFILQNVLYRFSTFPVDDWFALSVGGLRHGFVWQLLTYQFMHGGWLHLLLNCWAIYVFGREVEETLGRNSFLTLYFPSGVIGGLVPGAGRGAAGRRFCGAGGRRVCRRVRLGGRLCHAVSGASPDAVALLHHPGEHAGQIPAPVQRAAGGVRPRFPDGQHRPRGPPGRHD